MRHRDDLSRRMIAFVALMVALLLPCATRAQETGFSGNQLGPGGLSAEPGGLSGLTAPATGSGAPRAQVETPVFDFGTVISGIPVKHTFRVKNVGSAPLIIGAVMTSCGCTAAQPTKNTVLPGEDSDVAVTFDTRSDKGPATRTITVMTNDPKHQQLNLTLKGDVKVQVEAAPSPVAFGNVRHGTAQSRQVTITDTTGGKDFKVNSIANSSKDIKVTEQPRTDGQPGAALTVTVLNSMPAGPFNDIVKVATNRAPLEVAVFGTVVGDLTVNPPQVSFGIVPHHAGVLRTIRLTNSGDRAVKVVAISSSSQSVTAAVDPVTPGKVYKITIQLRPNTPDGKLLGMLAIKTDDPQQQTLQVPFYGIVGSFRG
jgi:Protein of unknown function (DUF1573)/Flagellar-associated PapD-like